MDCFRRCWSHLCFVGWLFKFMLLPRCPRIYTLTKKQAYAQIRLRMRIYQQLYFEGNKMRVQELIDLLREMPSHKMVVIDQEDDWQEIIEVVDEGDYVSIQPKEKLLIGGF